MHIILSANTQKNLVVKISGSKARLNSNYGVLFNVSHGTRTGDSETSDRKLSNRSGNFFSPLPSTWHANSEGLFNNIIRESNQNFLVERKKSN